jgi:hypothetical protein
MSVFTATLFQLLDAATVCVLNDDEIESISDCGVSAAGNPVMRLVYGDDDHFFEDQQVLVTDGILHAVTAKMDDEYAPDPTTHRLELFLRRPIAQSDLV